jgi:hypothetical protein
MTPRLIFLDRSVPDAAKQGQANAQGVSELGPIFCGFVPTLAAEPVGTKRGSSDSVFGFHGLRRELRQQHD